MKQRRHEEKSEGRIKNLLLESTIKYKKQQPVSETQVEESVPLSDSQVATLADNNSTSLGVNSPAVSTDKDNTKSSEKQISNEKIIQKEDNVGKKLVEDRKNYLSHRRDLEDFVSYRNPIAEEAGIYQDPSGWAVVKNGRFTIAAKQYFRSGLEEKVVGRGGELDVTPKEIALWQEQFSNEGELPNTSTELNYSNIYRGIQKADELQKQIHRKAETDKFKAKQSGYEGELDSYVIIGNNSDSQMFNLSELKFFADAALRFNKENDIRSYTDARNRPVLEINTHELKARVVGLSEVEAQEVNLTEQMRTNPQEAYANIVEAFGGNEQEAQAIITEQRGVLQTELEKLAKKREKTTDLNERVKIAKQMKELEGELASYDELLKPREEVVPKEVVEDNQQPIEAVEPTDTQIIKPVKKESKRPVETHPIENLPQENINYKMSDELDENGKQFIISSDGTTVYGQIGEDTGLESAPIKLSIGESKLDKNGHSLGYGLLHIEDNHGEQIRNAGYSSVEEFVEIVAKNYETIREGNIIGNKQTYLLEMSDKHNNTLFVQLSNDGTYYKVNSAGIFRKKYSRRKPKVSSLPEIGNNFNTVVAEVNRSQNNSVTATNGNPSELSASKDNTKSSEKQIFNEKIIQKEDNVGKKLVEDRKNYLSHRRDLEDFVSYRNPIVEEAGIYQDPSGWAVVKNGRFTIAAKQYFRSGLEEKVVGRSSELDVTPKEIALWQEQFSNEGELPNTSTELNYSNIYRGIQKADELQKQIHRKAETDKFKAKQSGYEGELDSYVIIDNNSDSQMFNLSELKFFADAALRFNKENDIRSYTAARNRPVLEINTPELKARVVGLSEVEANKKMSFDNAITLDARNGSVSMSSNLKPLVGQAIARRMAIPKLHKSLSESETPSAAIDTELREAFMEEVVGRIEEAGIPVITDESTGQEILDIYENLAEQDNSLKKSIEAKHGSGAKFDVFDHSFIGTGEGAQAYGYGTYLAGGKTGEDIARGYAIRAAENKSLKPNYDFADVIDSLRSGNKDSAKEMERALRAFYGEKDAKALKNIALVEEAIDQIIIASRSDIHPGLQRISIVWEYMVENPYEFANDAIDKNLFNTHIKSEFEGLVVYLNDIVSKIRDKRPIDFKEVVSHLRERFNVDSGDALENLVYKINEKYRSDRYLYTVDIPDDNGHNYLYWEKSDDFSEEFLSKIRSAIESRGGKSSAFLPDATTAHLEGKELYHSLSNAISESGIKERSDKVASEILSDLGYVGITMPQNFLSGHWDTENRNYVIFNPKDAKIRDVIKFFKSKDGTKILGFTQDGKIYFNPEAVQADTPIHEYTHIWASVMQKGNPAEWENIVNIFKTECKDIWEQVKQNYPELKTDSEIAEEVLSQYSGSKGKEKLDELANNIKNHKSLSGVAKMLASRALNKLRDALKEFWNWVGRDLLHIHFRNAEEVADRVMYDLLNKTDLKGVEVKDARFVKGEELKYSKKRALETVSVSSKEEHQPTAISSADGAKIIQNLPKSKYLMKK